MFSKHDSRTDGIVDKLWNIYIVKFFAIAKKKRNYLSITSVKLKKMRTLLSNDEARSI